MPPSPHQHQYHQPPPPIASPNPLVEWKEPFQLTYLSRLRPVQPHFPAHARTRPPHSGASHDALDDELRSNMEALRVRSP